MKAENEKAIFAALICLCKKGPSSQIEISGVARTPAKIIIATAIGAKCSLE